MLESTDVDSCSLGLGSPEALGSICTAANAESQVPPQT